MDVCMSSPSGDNHLHQHGTHDRGMKKFYFTSCMSLLQIIFFVINAVIAADCQQFQIPLLVSLMLLESNEKWQRHQLQPQHHNAAE